MSTLRRVRPVLGYGILMWLLAGWCAYGQAPPEPEGYRLENFRAPTPGTLKGATVIGTAEVEGLWRKGSAAFIDVMPRPERPADLPADTLWRSPPRDSIPGAKWLANVGYGVLAPEIEAYFRNGLAAAANGDVSRPLVFFCQRNCWMSWNAAKRALSYGYSSVYWYPEGTDGWKEAGLPVERVEKSP
jgi:PQQ-dependent catabolism-associated CXXCW motif protein